MLDLIGDDGDGMGSLEVTCSFTTTSLKTTYTPAVYKPTGQIVCDLTKMSLDVAEEAEVEAIIWS